MPAESTVFVVDDDDRVLESMRWLFGGEGLAVETCSSANKFLASYRLDRPGCLVLDLQMPEMDGLELQRRLASQGPHLPIIFVSGYADVLQCAEAMKAGAVDFLEKPVDDDRILSAVRKALEKDLERHVADTSNAEIQARIECLTPRECDVMCRLLRGNSIKTMASKLGISFQTVAKHRARVLEKLGANNETELVRMFPCSWLAE